MSSKPSKFELRDKSHEIIATYSEKELIEAIESGKFTGEEEICAAGSSKWQHLASHATFYDAFLKRVHGKEYVPKKKQSKEISEEGTKQNKKHTEIEAEQINKNTTERKPEKEKGTGLTLRDSEIKSLFKSGSIEKTEVQDQEMNFPSKEEEEKSLPKIHMTFTEREAERQENTDVERIKDRRRIALWALVLVLVLLTLFNLGQSKEENDLTGPAKAASPFGNAAGNHLPAVAITNEMLMQLAGYYTAQDTVLGYRNANRILSLANYHTENTIDLIRQKCAVLSELVILEEKKEELIKNLKEMISLGREKDPQGSAFYRAEAKILLAEKNYVESRKLGNQAKETNPEDPENALLLSEIALESKNIGDSKVFLESIEPFLQTSVRKNRILARVSLELQNWKTLEIAAQSCVEGSPAHSECYYLLAEGYAKQNQLKKARAFLDLSGRLSAFTTREISKAVFERLAQLEQVFGKEEDTVKYRQFASTFTDESKQAPESFSAARKELEAFLVGEEFLIKRGQEQIKDKKPPNAFKYFIAAVSLNPKSREAILSLGRSFESDIAGTQDYKKIEAFYQMAIDEDLGFVKAFVRLGTVETEQYNFEKAHNYLVHALQLDELDPDAYFELGKHYFKRQDYVSSMDVLLKAQQNNFQSDELYYYFGLTRQKLDRSKIRDSMEAFYTAYTLNPENYDALSAWLKLKLIASEKAFAIKFLKSLQDADPKNAEILRVLGEVYLANSEPRRAVNYFHRSLDINNRNSKTRMSLARALESIGELDTAAEEFHESSRLDPKNAEGFYESARVLFQLQNYPKMAIVVKKLLDLSPNYPGSHKLGSLVAQSTGDKEKAVSEMKKEVENNPENYSFVIEFAELYMRFNLFNEAISELSKITNLPTETALDKTKASQYVKVRLTAYYLLSGCYRLLAKPELAEGAVKLGLKVDAENALLRRELCFVYADQQRFPEATRECEYYLRRNPAAEDVDRIKQKLKDMNIDYF